MKNNSLVDVAKHQNKLRKIVSLNEAGATIFTDKAAMALYGKVSKSEFINAFKADIEKTATYLVIPEKPNKVPCLRALSQLFSYNIYYIIRPKVYISGRFR